jgi:branched-chain amino acid transport system permease protein
MTARQRAATWAVLLLLALVPLLASALHRPDFVALATQVAVFAIAAVALDLLLGHTGLPSFGHAGFFGLGGYVVGILAFHAADGSRFLDLIPGATAAWVVWPAAVLVAGLAALAIGALSLRTSGISFIMITLAFAQMLFFLFVSLKVYGGDDGLGFRGRNPVPGISPRDDTGFYYVCLALLLAALGAGCRLTRSRFGQALAGIRQNERRIAALGLSPYRYKLAAFVLSGATAGLAGALYANMLRFISPDALSWTLSGEFMVMVVLGGAGTLMGPVLGAAALVLLQSALAQWTEHWMIVMGPILVLVVLAAPRGIWGLVGGRAG